MRSAFLGILTILFLAPPIHGSNCKRSLETLDLESKFSRGFARKMQSVRNGDLIDAAIVLDTFMPVANRGRNPSLVVLSSRLQTAGIYVMGMPDMWAPVPHDGLRTLYVRGSKSAFETAAKWPQIVWLAKSVSDQRLDVLARELRGDDVRTERKRYRLEERLTERYRSLMQTALTERVETAALSKDRRDPDGIDFGLGKTNPSGGYRSHRVLGDIEGTVPRWNPGYEHLNLLPGEAEVLGLFDPP